MFSQWVIGITLIANSNLGSVLSKASLQSAAAQKQVGGLTKSVGGFASAAKIVDRTMIGLGIGAAATFAIGLKGASDLQNATVQAAIAMGKTGSTVAQTTQNMREFRDVALEMSKITGQSLPDAMNVIATMASAGLSGKQIKLDARAIAQFTDILHFNKKDHMEYSEAAALGAGLAHDMRLFNASDIKYGLGAVAQMGYLSPHNTSALATQVRRMAPMLENVLPGSVQSRASTIVSLAAWADRMGNLPFAGSAISQMVTQMIAPRSKRVMGGLEALGVYDAHGNNRYFDNKTGTFDVMGALKQIQAHVSNARAMGEAGPAIKALFSGTQNMQRILMALTSKESLQAYASIQRQQGGMGNPAAWLDKTQTLLMGELSTQTGLLTSNFKTLATLLAEGFIPPLTRFVSWLAAKIGDLDSFLNNHPKTAFAGGVGLLGAAGYAGVRMAMMGHNVIHAFTTLGKHPHLGVGMSHWGSSGAAAAKGGLRFGAIGEGVAGGLGSLFGFQAIRRELAPVGKWIGSTLGGAIKGFLPRITPGMFPIKMIFGPVVEGFAKLGTRFIPLVGEILLIVDALNFFRTHMKNVGQIIGEVAGWLAKNFPGIIRGAAGLAVQAMKDLIQGILDVLNPMNWVHAIGDLISGVKSGYQDATKPDPSTSRQPIQQHIHIDARGHANPAKTGQAVVHELRKAGVIRNGAVTGGYAIPATH
jgi:hypothetical protein